MSMRLKKTKEEVLNEIQGRVFGSATNALNCSLNNLLKLESNYGNGQTIKFDSQQMSYAIQNAIAMAVTEGFRTILENQYTDEDFERDLTLSP